MTIKAQYIPAHSPLDDYSTLIVNISSLSSPITAASLLTLLTTSGFCSLNFILHLVSVSSSLMFTLDVSSEKSF